MILNIYYKEKILKRLYLRLMDRAYSLKKSYYKQMDVPAVKQYVFLIEWHQPTCIIIVAIIVVFKNLFMSLPVCDFNRFYSTLIGNFDIFVHCDFVHSSPLQMRNISSSLLSCYSTETCFIYLLHVGIECFAVFAVMIEYLEHFQLKP